MLSPTDFHVEIAYDDAGLLVTVVHVPTNQRRSGRPIAGEKCSRVQQRLHSELVRTFCNMQDFTSEHGRCVVDGKIGCFCRVEHLPSKRSKSLDSITSPGVKNLSQVPLEELLNELWRDGVLALKSDV